jgi:CubicO group peptidase (beta-lactamase class C family)
MRDNTVSCGLWIFLGFCILSRSVSAAAESAHAGPADAIQSIINVPDPQTSPGCATGIVQNGKTIAVQTSGVADIVSHRALDPDTLFYAASVSKQFTALLIVTLVQNGKVGLDDDVRKWIPELPAYETPVTVRMLLHHTSGIRDSLDILRLSGVLSFSKVSRTNALQLLYRQSNTNFRPGTEYKYSNGGYLLLSEIVERASGTPFAEFGNKTIFAPLGMKRSFFLADAPPSVADVAHGYTKSKSGDGFELRDTYPLMSGSGGLMTTIHDLILFERDAEVRHKVWTEPITRILLEPGKFTDGRTVIDDSSGLAYGAGLTVGLRKGQYWVEHGGGAEGFSHLYARLPERHEGVILLCNRVDLGLQPKIDALFAAVDPGVFSKSHAPDSSDVPHPQRPANTSAASIDAADAAKLAGQYYSKDLDATYVVSVSPDEKMSVAVSSRWASAGNLIAPQQYVLLEGGSWGEADSRGGPFLNFDAAGMSFTLSTDRARSIRFQRIRL